MTCVYNVLFQCSLVEVDEVLGIDGMFETVHSIVFEALVEDYAVLT